MTSDDETTPIVPENATEKGRRCHGNCKPDSTCFRYTLMVVICVVAMGDFFGGGTPYALEDHILKDLGITESKFMIFASCMQWAQAGVALLGGYLVDRVFGIRFSVVLAATIMAAAQSLFAGAAMVNSFWTMVGARTVFGAFIGLEWIAINKMCTKWFKDKELTFVIGLKMSLGRLGWVLTFNMMDQLYSAFNVDLSNLDSLGSAMFVGAALCLMSAIFSFWYFYMDKKAEAQNIPPAPEARVGSGDVVMPRQLRVFPLQFWLLSMTLVFFGLVTPTLSGLGQVFYERKYDTSLDSASLLNSLNYIVCVFAFPPMGIVVDKVGRNLYWILVGSLLQLGGLLLMTLTFINPYIAMSILGASNVLASLGIWPLFPYIVQMDYLGTAFGIVRTCNCLTVAASSYLAGYFADFYGYVFMELLLLMCSCAAMVFGTLLYVVDKAQAGNLNLGPTARILHEKMRRGM